MHFPNKLFCFDLFSLGKPKKRSKISSNSIQSLLPEIMEGKKKILIFLNLQFSFFLLYSLEMIWKPCLKVYNTSMKSNHPFPFFFLYTKYREIELDYKKNLQSGGKTMDTPMQLYKGRRNWTISWGLFWLWMDYLLWFDFSHALNYAVDVSWQVIRVILHVSQDHVKLFLKSCTSLSLTL